MNTLLKTTFRATASRAAPSARHVHLSPRLSSSSAGSGSSSTGPASSNRLSLFGIASVISTGAVFYAMGTLYPPQVVSFLFPHPAPPPVHIESVEGLAQTALVESSLHALPLVRELREQADKYYETRPYADYPEEKRVHSLTSGSLRGPGKLAVAPLLFSTHDDSETVILVHAGRSLCGHDGIIHGGLLATLLDECLARTAIVNLPNKIGVTANLAINYRAPTKADQFLVIRTKLTERKGRKAMVVGRVEDLAGTLLVEASATFVEPRYASMLQSSAVTAALGKPVSRQKGEKVPVPQEAAI